jgi:hypothetical protein
MSDALRKAEDAVRDATANTDVVRIVAAVLATQQAAQQQAPAPPSAPTTDRRPVGLYIAGGIGAAVALAFLAMAAAVLAVAVAVGAICATACVLVLRSMWRDFTNR